MIRRDGEIRWIHSFGRRVLDASGRASWHGMSVDLTTHVTAGQARALEDVEAPEDAEAPEPN